MIKGNELDDKCCLNLSNWFKCVLNLKKKVTKSVLGLEIGVN